MKFVKIIINLLVIVFIMDSCIMKPEPYDTVLEYTISNVSNHNVKLIVFDALINDTHKDTTFLLSPNTEIQYQYKHLTYIDGPFGPAADTIYIVFNNNKQIVYLRDDGKHRSIYKIDNWDGGHVGKQFYQYKYTITDEDYANAVPIE